MGESRDRLFFLPACHRPNPPRRDRRKGRPERPRHPGCNRRINKLLRGRLWPRSPAWRPRAVPRRAGLAGAHLPSADQEKTAAKTKRPAANKIFPRNKKTKNTATCGQLFRHLGWGLSFNNAKKNHPPIAPITRRGLRPQPKEEDLTQRSWRGLRPQPNCGLRIADCGLRIAD